MGLGGFFKSIAGPIAGLGAGILTGNPAIGLGVAGAISGSQKQGEANELTDEQLAIMRQDIADRAPLRAGFTNRALGPLQSAPNLSSAFTPGTSSNVFSPAGRGGEPVSLANIIPPDEGFAPAIAPEVVPEVVPEPRRPRGQAGRALSRLGKI